MKVEVLFEEELKNLKLVIKFIDIFGLNVVVLLGVVEVVLLVNVFVNDCLSVIEMFEDDLNEVDNKKEDVM